MNAEIESAFAAMLRAAVVPASAPNAGATVIPAGWQIEPNTSGNVLDPEKDWVVCKVEENTRVAGPLWRGTFSFHVLVRALVENATPADLSAAVRNIRAWLRLTPAADLAAAFAAHASSVALAGTFVAGSPDPEQERGRWRSALQVTCGWREI